MRPDDVGGTWYWNRYPGARCDIESLTYSYSWSDELQQEWRWTERYAAQPEILRYLQHVADRFDLRRDDRLRHARRERRRGTRTASRWIVSRPTAATSCPRAFFVMATGCLSVPRHARHPGVGALRRRRAPHGALAARGRRRARQAGRHPRHGVVGGAGAADHRRGGRARHRLPAHAVLLHPGLERRRSSDEADRERKARYAEFRELERRTPGGNPWFGARGEGRRRDAGGARAGARGALPRSAASSCTRRTPTPSTTRAPTSSWPTSCATRSASASTTPRPPSCCCPYDYPFATKRMCIDTDYFEAYNRDNVRLVSVRETPIDEFTERGLRIGDEEFAFDVLVLASGFDAMTGAVLGVDIRGRGGRSVREKWEDGPALVPRPHARRLPEPLHHHRPAAARRCSAT